MAAAIGLFNRALLAHAAAERRPPWASGAPGARLRGPDRLRQRRGGRRGASPRPATSTSRSGASGAARREEELRPQERVAAVLGGRERIDACEPLLLRARADLDARPPPRGGPSAARRPRGAAGRAARRMTDPHHEADMDSPVSPQSRGRRGGEQALRGDLDENLGEGSSSCSRSASASSPPPRPTRVAGTALRGRQLHCLRAQERPINNASTASTIPSFSCTTGVQKRPSKVM